MEKICQSCGMNIESNEIKGTNKDESMSEEFCSFCFKNGEYTNTNTLNEQVEMGLKYSLEYQNVNTQEEKDKIKDQARQYLSNLKRWKCTCTDECASGYNPNCTCTSSECNCTIK